jgi:glycyl-tRNA synthetase (class II)
LKHQSSNNYASIGIAERNENIILTWVLQDKEFESSECQFFLDAVTVVA